MGLNRGRWRGRRVLVTGHTGFKGAWLCLWLQYLGAEVTGMSLAPEHCDGTFNALEPWGPLDSHIIDLRNEEATTSLVAQTRPDTIFHLAAQSLVARGYRDPVGTYATNVMGTVNVLQAARRSGTVRVIVVVTSDKVYHNSGTRRPFSESDPLGGDDPYSSSKACCDLLAATWSAAFFEDSDIRLTRVRAGNVVGGGDWAEARLLPDAIRALVTGEPIAVRNPDATRPWQHVLDPTFGYLLVAQGLLGEGKTVPDAVNFGPHPSASMPVKNVVEQLISLWGHGRWIHRPSEYNEKEHLTLDATLAHKALGWQPILDVGDALTWTVDWHRAQSEGMAMRDFSLAQIREYEERLP